MRLIWAVLCRHAIVEQETNTLSLMDVIEQITIEFNESPIPPPTKPAALPIPLELISLWQKGPDRGGGTFKVTLRTPQGSTSPGHATGTIEPGPAPRSRITTRIPNLPWRGEGEYAFVVQLSTKSAGWRTVADVPFWIKLKNPMALSQQQTSPPAPDRKTRRKSAKRVARKRRR